MDTFMHAWPFTYVDTKPDILYVQMYIQIVGYIYVSYTCPFISMNTKPDVL